MMRYSLNAPQPLAVPFWVPSTYLFMEKQETYFGGYSFNSFGAKFQTTNVVCFFILTNDHLERRLYVKLKDWMSNRVDPDEMGHWASSSGSMLFAKAIIITCGSERVNLEL